MKSSEGTKTDSLYFLGIGGTGMGSVAGLFKQAGFEVCGSDSGIYPPISSMLKRLSIQTFSPYSEENIKKHPCDAYVIGNSISIGQTELKAIQTTKKPYFSFPQILGEQILSKKKPIVITGTHGKTSTTSLMTHVLNELGYEPGYLIGGIPKNFENSFDLGKGDFFAIEGDEYDTAFFDKKSKFLHYRPEYLLINNIEFDHADIFSNLDQIITMFKEVSVLVKNPQKIIANFDDKNVVSLLKNLNLYENACGVSISGSSEAQIKLLSLDFNEHDKLWHGAFHTKIFGEIRLKSHMQGNHNWFNIGQIIATIERMISLDNIKKPSAECLAKAIESFAGIKRRLEILAENNDISVYEDFAHHPTAVEKVISAFKVSNPKRRLIIAFEPKNATSRRNIFTQRYADAFSKADITLLAPCPEDKRVNLESKMNTKTLATLIQSRGIAFDRHQDLREWLNGNSASGDAIIFMTSGSFEGIQHQFAKDVNDGILS